MMMRDCRAAIGRIVSTSGCEVKLVDDEEGDYRVSLRVFQLWKILDQMLGHLPCPMRRRADDRGAQG
jgi:hypothetical protein